MKIGNATEQRSALTFTLTGPTALHFRVPFISGFGYGLATALLIGPVFFTLLKASLDHGARGGILVAVGIIVSDVVAVLICASGYRTIMHSPISSAIMALGAGVILAALGIRYLLVRVRDTSAQGRLNGRGALRLFTGGFLVNFINPFVFGVWFALVAHANMAHAQGHGVTFFLSGVLAGIFTSDVAKALLAHRLKPLLSPAVLRKAHIGIGVALIFFSARALMHAWTLWND